MGIPPTVHSVLADGLVRSAVEALPDEDEVKTGSELCGRRGRKVQPGM